MGIDRDGGGNFRRECGDIHGRLCAERKPHESDASAIHLLEAAQVFGFALRIVDHLRDRQPVAEALVNLASRAATVRCVFAVMADERPTR